MNISLLLLRPDLTCRQYKNRKSSYELTAICLAWHWCNINKTQILICVVTTQWLKYASFCITVYLLSTLGKCHFSSLLCITPPHFLSLSITPHYSTLHTLHHSTSLNITLHHIALLNITLYYSAILCITTTSLSSQHHSISLRIRLYYFLTWKY